MSRPARPIRESHTLDVVLECLRARNDRNPDLIKDLVKIAKEYKGRERVFDAVAERSRVVCQRARFEALPSLGPDGVAVDEFKKAMIDRAIDLLDIGQCEACDALLEFMPEADVQVALDDYFEE